MRVTLASHDKWFLECRKDVDGTTRKSWIFLWHTRALIIIAHMRFVINIFKKLITMKRNDRFRIDDYNIYIDGIKKIVELTSKSPR